MNIISDFKDYYDCVLKLDQDRDYTLNRITTSLTIEEVIKLTAETKYDIRKRYFFDTERIKLIDSNVFVLVVCGKVYPGSYDIHNNKCYLWHIDKHNFSLHAYREGRRYGDNQLEFDYKKFEANTLPFLDGLKNVIKDCAYYKLKITNMPVFVAKDYYKSEIKTFVYGAIKYPVLKEYDFAKVMDPYTIYQELDMWFGQNASINQIASTVGTDEELAEAKGFDRKYSFRKDKKQ